jgi:anti-sigma factor (TIGR02949 family)
MITCAEAVKQLWDFLDNALAPNELAGVEEHLAFCRKCCGETEFAGELQEFLSSNRVEPIPTDVRKRLHQVLESITRR